MNILIVDDDAYIIRVIKNQINWSNIGIEKVYTALNTARAKEILLEESIDILLTDIEMPKESGLQLMEWIISQDMHPQAICLTCHAEFHFARDAIRLGFSEYCVKPIEFKELEEILRKSVIKHSNALKKATMEIEGAKWKDNRKIVASDFWHNLLQGKFDRQIDQIVRLAKMKEVDYIFDQTYRIVLITLCSIGSHENVWKEDQNLMRYALTNILSEKFAIEESNGMMGWVENNLWLIVHDINENVLDDLEDYIKICSELLGILLAVYVGEERFGEDLGKEFQELIKRDIDNVNRTSDIYITNDNNKFNEIEWLQNHLIEKYQDSFFSGDYNSFFRRIKELFNEDSGWNRVALEGVMFNVLQFTFAKLMDLNIVAEQFYDDSLRSAHKNSFQSLEEARKYLLLLETKFQEATEQKNKESSIIADVKKYIRAHIEEKLSRKDIADSVFLSADYVTKLFKKETGTTLIEFITDEKINAAKEMIKEQKLLIGEVAQRLCYDNFSYFSEMFRKKTGMSPSDYKKHVSG